MAAVPSPQRAATCSTEAVVDSSSRRASSTRCPVAQWCGVEPVSAGKRRAKVRSDIIARRASAATDRPWSRCSRAHSRTAVLEWALEHLDQDLSVAALARRAMMSERTFARRFPAETGSTPHHWATGQRVLLARRLLESTTASVEQVAARCGLGTAAILRHHFTRVVGTSPQAYRRSFCTIPA